MKIALLLLIIAGNVSLALAQPEMNESPSRRTVNEKGWDLKVDLSEFEIASKSVVEIDTVSVDLTIYRIGTRPRLTLENGSQCEIRNLQSYKVDGVIFAVEWKCYGIGVGCMVAQTFLDEDLDGKFEVKTYLEKLQLPPSIAKRYAPPPPPRPKDNP